MAGVWQVWHYESCYAFAYNWLGVYNITMNEDKLKELNVEMTALLEKYNCSLQVAHNIQVVENPPKEEELALDLKR